MEILEEFFHSHLNEFKQPVILRGFKGSDIHNIDWLFHFIMEKSIYTSKINPSIPDWKRYLQENRDLGKAGINECIGAMRHYLLHGMFEKRTMYIKSTNLKYVYDFDWRDYLQNNPDVVTSYNYEALAHWVAYGSNEKRVVTKEIKDLYIDNFQPTLNDNTNQTWSRLVKENINNYLKNSNEINMYDLMTLEGKDLQRINNNIHDLAITISQNFKNILFISGDYPGYGGAATNCYHLQNFFKKFKCNVFGFYFNYEKGDNAKYESTSEYIVNDFNYIHKLKFKPDLVILKSPIDVNIKTIYKCPVYYFVGGIYKNGLDKYFYNIQNIKEQKKYHNNSVLKQIEYCDKTYVNSNHTQFLLKKWYNKHADIFYSSFVPFYKKKPLIDSDFEKRKYDYALIVSNFDRKIKNIEHSIRFLRGKKNVILIGKGSSKYKSHNFTCVELINMNELENYYKQIKYIVQDSFYESCSNVKIESLFNGCKINLNWNSLPICNKMKLSNIKNGVSWIHGKHKKNILITIFIISIQDHQLQYCLNSVNKLNLDFPVIVNVIQNIYPTNKAYDEMRKRCVTHFFIQLDEDMQLFSDAIETIYKTYDANTFLNIYKLYDDYLGISKQKTLYGIKLYNQNIMKNFETLKDNKNNDVATSAVDRNWHKKIMESGYKLKTSLEVIGYHEQYRTNFDLAIKYSKITNNLLNPDVASKADDICRLLIPINKVKFDYNNLIILIINHLVCNLNYTQENIVKNLNKLNDIFNTIKPSPFQVVNYNFPKNMNCYQMDKYCNININHFFDMFHLKKDLNSIHKSCIFGIMNKIFDNYYYSYDKYPYKLFKYFNNFIGDLKLTIISHELPNYGGSASNSYAMFKFYQKYFDITCIFIDSGNYIAKIEDKEKYLQQYSDMKIIYHNEDVNQKLIEYIQKTDIILLRSPQVPQTIDIDFKLLKFLSKKIISIFGGGMRNNFSRKLEEIKLRKELSINDYIENYNQTSGNIDIQTQLLKNERYMKVIEQSDYISTNTRKYDNIFKTHFEKKYIGYYPFSAINKYNFQVCTYKDDTNWVTRKYDIILIGSSLKRTVKGVIFFLDIVKNLPYNIIIIGNNMNYILPQNVTHIPFTNDVNNYLKQSKLLISTSLFEASPNTLFEGINQGCNILTSSLVHDNEFKNECVVTNYPNKIEWNDKISYLLKNKINSLKDRNTLQKSLDKFSQSLINMNISENKKLVLIITFLEEDINSLRVHYSKAKNYLLADSLIKLGYNVFFLTNKVNYVTFKDKYYYIHHKFLTSKELSNFSYIFFGLHNEEYLTPLIKETNIFNTVLKCKKIYNNCKVICKMCNYPETIDKHYDSYNLFDKIILQTDLIQIPQYISKNITKNDNKYNIQQIIEYCNKNNINNKFYFSEMTFPKIDYKNMKSNMKITLDPKITHLVYMGRLTSDNGMNCVYLIKLMKLLGSKFKLWIIPGSFKLPNEYPTKKHSPKTDKNELKLIQSYFTNYKLDFNEKNVPNYFNKEIINELQTEQPNEKLNIEVLPPINYGEHFNIISNFDIGIGFSENKNVVVPQGSAKLFDYMYANIKIVFENGWHNNKYVEKYKFGKLVNNNSSITDFKNTVLQVASMKQKDILYNQFVQDHNNEKRCIDILKQI